jgi:hypothetical protein
MSTHTNPGTINPADQAYPAVLPPQLPPTPASAAVVNANGELQLPSMLTVWSAPSSVLGLAANVHAGSASQVRAQAPVTADTRPPARDVHPGAGRPGGLPANVNIR